MTQRTHSFLVVMNPFASDAVVDVVLYLSGRPPVRNSAWTDLPIRAGSSVALDVGSRALGQSIVGADVTATRGRIAVGSLAVREGGSVRSTMASPAYAGSWILPVAGGSGGGIVSVLVPGDLGVRYGGTLLQRQEDAQTAGNLTVVRQGGTSAVSAPVTRTCTRLSHPSAGEGVMGAGLREAGAGPDDASTGAPRRRPRVGRAADGRRRRRVPALVLVNPGTRPSR